MKKLKDSGVEWIGQIPAEWKRVKLKEVTNIIMGQSPEAQDIKDFGNIPFMQGNREFGSIYPNAVKFCDNSPKKSRIGDILLSVRAPVGAINVSDKVYAIGRGLCSICATSINSKFLMYFLMLIMQDTKKFGQGSTFDAITIQELKQLPVLLPPINTQNRIASYLDRKCAEIDAIIAKQQQIIEKLKEYKLSVITEAVTKGLDPNVPMKDSGVEWIGKIPEHWAIHKFCWDYSAMLGKMLDAKRITGDSLHPYIKNADVQWDFINFENLDEMDFSDEEKERYSICPGDLMVCEGGEIGKCAVVPNDAPNGIYYQKALHRVRRQRQNSGSIDFLSKVLYCMAKNNCLNTSPEKATIAHLPGDALSQLRIPAPPFREQNQIAGYLKKKCAKIDEMAVRKQAVVEKLQKYKKSLIYEVVTGKREVS